MGGDQHRTVRATVASLLLQLGAAVLSLFVYYFMLFALAASMLGMSMFSSSGAPPDWACGIVFDLADVYPVSGLVFAAGMTVVAYRSLHPDSPRRWAGSALVIAAGACLGMEIGLWLWFLFGTPLGSSCQEIMLVLLAGALAGGALTAWLNHLSIVRRTTPDPPAEL